MLFDKSMSNLLTIILPLITTTLGVILTYIIMHRKMMVYEILFNGPIFTIEEDKLKNRLKLDGEPIENIEGLKYIALRIQNFLFEEISKEDYASKEGKALFIDFGNRSKIIFAEIGETEPENLKPNLEIDDGILLIEPMLLNRNDYITIKTLIKNYEKEIEIKSRIKGVKEIIEKTKLISNLYKYLAIIWGSVTAVQVVFSIYVSSDILLNLAILPLFVSVWFMVKSQEQTQKMTGYEEKVVDRIKRRKD